MIIGSFVCTRLSKEITDLARAMNIQIRSVDSDKSTFKKNGVDFSALDVCFVAHRQFEASQFIELISATPEVVEVTP